MIRGKRMGLVLKLSKDTVIQVGDRVQVLYKGNRKTIVVDGRIELSFNEKKVWIEAPEDVQIVRESLSPELQQSVD
jgi:sRNA-binding carbon storage regulator CsrA